MVLNQIHIVPLLLIVQQKLDLISISAIWEHSLIIGGQDVGIAQLPTFRVTVIKYF